MYLKKLYSIENMSSNGYENGVECSNGSCKFRPRVMMRKNKIRGIVHSVMGSGTARIVFDGKHGFKVGQRGFKN